MKENAINSKMSVLLGCVFRPLTVKAVRSFENSEINHPLTPGYISELSAHPYREEFLKTRKINIIKLQQIMISFIFPP
jgi:hypothetical protein